MKRIIRWLTVVLVAVALLAVTAMPAMAAKFPEREAGSCGEKGIGPGEHSFFGEDFSTVGGGGEGGFTVALHFCK